MLKLKNENNADAVCDSGMGMSFSMHFWTGNEGNL